MGYILSFEAVTRATRDLKRTEQIVLTHGVFDLFHIGQSEFLEKSKEKGKILIVGVDSDELVSTYKGVKGPVIPFLQRINLISKLQYVDFVFPLNYLPRIDKEVTTNKYSQYHLNIYRELKLDTVTFGRKYGGLKTIIKGRKSFKSIKFKNVLHKYDRVQQSTTKIIDTILQSNMNKGK